MSRRRKKDYKKVLKKVKRMFPTPPAVQGIVLDFEAALWQAIRHVFPTVTISGCAFHWTQAVWRKAQAVGLSTQYQGDAGTHKLMRKLLALPLLPAEHVTPAFEALRRKAGDGRLQELCQYVQVNWIDGSVWTPEDWSVYGQSVRTNNDCEGWHRRLNCRTSGPPPFYMLVELLFKEAEYVKTQVKLISERKLRKTQRSSSRAIQARIFSVWDDYSTGIMSVEKLLSRLSSVYGATVM